MLIRVIYQNGKYDMVNNDLLDNYIKNEHVIQFKRKDGWATIGVDSIRDPSRHRYIGPERRRYLR
jgi:hypothetical protein